MTPTMDFGAQDLGGESLDLRLWTLVHKMWERKLVITYDFGSPLVVPTMAHLQIGLHWTLAAYGRHYSGFRRAIL